MALTKAAAFQFYPKEWRSSTAHMSPESKGAYIDLLGWAWDNGPLPASHEQRARIAGMSQKKFQKVWREISGKWRQRDEGFINLRLERQRIELEKYRQKLSDAGKRGAAVTWPGHRPGHRPGQSQRLGLASGLDIALRSSQDPQDQDPRDAPRALADVRKQLRAAVHQQLDAQPNTPTGELTELVKDLGRPLGFTWNTSGEIVSLVESVCAERAKRIG